MDPSALNVVALYCRISSLNRLAENRLESPTAPLTAIAGVTVRNSAFPWIKGRQV